MYVCMYLCMYVCKCTGIGTSGGMCADLRKHTAHGHIKRPTPSENHASQTRLSKVFVFVSVL